MDVSGYQHNFEGYCEKSSYQMSIYIERKITTKATHPSLVKNSLVSSVYLFVKNFEEESQPSSINVDTAKG